MYVRTKDGVYEVSEKTKYAQYSIRGMTMVKNADFQYISNENIIKQADTIEDLCDEFVLCNNQLNTCGVFDKKVITFKWLQNHLEIYKGMTIYGAIYTSKGLIYVAKMDDKGELELI